MGLSAVPIVANHYLPPPFTNMGPIIMCFGIKRFVEVVTILRLPTEALTWRKLFTRRNKVVASIAFRLSGYYVTIVCIKQYK